MIAGFLFDGTGTESGPYGALSCIIKNTRGLGTKMNQSECADDL